MCVVAYVCHIIFYPLVCIFVFYFPPFSYLLVIDVHYI